jgi:phosphatidylinositol alpha 1,6-mannosyltransferase
VNSQPRVALLCETFHEINGVALTARQLVAYAERHGFPLLAVHGSKQRRSAQAGYVRRVELTRGWASIGIESDLEYDFLFCRYAGRIRKELESFAPDVIHITSPGELGQIGAYLAHKMKIPLVASWHTNFHQFAARRLGKLLRFLPERLTRSTVAWSQKKGLQLLTRFYGLATVTLAPTPAQVEWLAQTLRKPSFLMPRGVDCDQFHPNRRAVRDDLFRLGFVGRVTPEKGVRVLAGVERALEKSGLRKFRILVVGDGSEMAWLKANLRHAEFAGVLRGDLLAEAYANMDLFVFPSRTDTFGNVIQEAAASGVASVVTDEGGPKHLVIPGITGCVASADEDFVAKVVELAHNRERLRQMGAAARENIAGHSWDAAFDVTYQAYRFCRSERQSEASQEKKLSMNKSQACLIP